MLNIFSDEIVFFGTNLGVSACIFLVGRDNGHFVQNILIVVFLFTPYCGGSAGRP